MQVNSTLFSLAVLACFSSAAASPSWADTRLGVAAYGDWRSDAPGVRRKLTSADMPPPLASAPAANLSQIAPRPAGAAPKVPPGFAVSEFASGLKQPRVVRIAPNGDIFVAESARRPHPRIPLGGRRFAADEIGCICDRAQPTLRHRILSAGAGSALPLRRHDRANRSLPLPQRRY